MRFFIILILTSCLCSCAIEFQIASQKTAIEEQILGAYQEMDEKLVLMTSVRAIDAQGKAKIIKLNELEKRATAARQNQQFNVDDLTELKRKEIIGESLGGKVSLVPSTKKTKDQELAKLIINEENRDRSVIWQRVIEKSPDLTSDDISLVRENYYRQMIEALEPGMWYETEDKGWVKK